MGRAVLSGLLAIAALAVAMAHAPVARSEGGVLVTTGVAPQEPRSQDPGVCPEGMVDVEGDYCSDLPEQRCLKWLSATGGRCAEFAPSPACPSATVHKHFCMDRFEYPNLAGDNPVVMKSWLEARDLCAASGKRLCGDSEWTLACEGPERLPYPYGLVRDATACNIDKAPINPRDEDLRRVDKRDAEARRLWQGEPSGTRERCRSAFGVQDLTGNVDEWVVNERGKPHKSALKGGYWSWVRGRCRPLTDGHEEDFRYYQIGFRCCADSATEVASRR